MKNKYHLLVQSILLCCLFGTKSFAMTPESQMLFFSLESPESYKTLQAINKIEEIEEQVVSYKTPFSYSLDTDTRWSIIHPETGTTIKTGIGSINNILFDTPGNYLLQISHSTTHNSDSCGHSHYPEKVHLEVSPFYMEFDFTSVNLTRELQGNRSLNGSLLTVNVIFDSFDKTTTTYTGSFTTAGLRTSLVGKLKNGETVLQPGTNQLEFQMEGQVSSNSYISIDFVDINGQIQSYNITNKIK